MMKTRDPNARERMEDRLGARRQLGELNWEDVPTPEQMQGDSEHLAVLRDRIRVASHTMLAALRSELGLDPLQAILTQKFDIQTGGITMSARALEDPMALATLRGTVIEVGNMDGDIGICAELPDAAGVLTLIGLSQDQARRIAPHYADGIEIIIRARPDDAGHVARLQPQ